MSQIIRLLAALVATSALLPAPSHRRRMPRPQRRPRLRAGEGRCAGQGQGALPAGLLRLHAEGAHWPRASPTRRSCATPFATSSTRASCWSAKRRRRASTRTPTSRPQMDLDGADRAGPRLRRRLDRRHIPVPDAALHKEYDTIKAQIGDKEYKVRHILVEKEDEAKDIIVALQKGEKFEKLAERSKDTGLEGQRRRSRLERAGQLRQAVRRRDDHDAEGQVHDDAGADAVRLARDRGRRHSRRQGADASTK